MRKNLPYRLRKEQNSIQRKRRLVPGGFEGNKGRQAVYFTLVNTVDRNPDKKYEAYNSGSLTTKRSALWTWRARKLKNSTSTKPLTNGCVIRFNTILNRMHQKKVIHRRDNGERHTPGFAARWCAYREDGRSWHKEYLNCKGNQE